VTGVYIDESSQAPDSSHPHIYEKSYSQSTQQTGTSSNHVSLEHGEYSECQLRTIRNLLNPIRPHSP